MVARITIVVLKDVDKCRFKKQTYRLPGLLIVYTGHSRRTPLSLKLGERHALHAAAEVFSPVLSTDVFTPTQELHAYIEFSAL